MRRRRWSLFVALGVAHLLGGMAAAQPTGAGWALIPSQPREIGTLYWALHDQTEAWLRLAPGPLDQAGRRVNLVFWTGFSGKDQKTVPDRIMLQALLESAGTVAVPHVTLTLRIDGAVEWDLVRPGRQFTWRYPSSCEGCSAIGVDAELTWKEFEGIAAATRIEGEALGLPIALEPADLDALRDFHRDLAAVTLRHPKVSPDANGSRD